MARPSKPVDLIVIEGKSHRTKEEIQYREEQEKKLRTGKKFQASKDVKADPEAYAEFKHLRKLFDGIIYVEGLDETFINRYCLLYAETKRMEEQLKGLEDKAADEDLDFKETLNLAKTIMGLDKQLMKRRDMLMHMEDRMFLNPTSRIKAIPKKPPKEEDEDPMAKLLTRRRAGGSGAVR